MIKFARRERERDVGVRGAPLSRRGPFFREKRERLHVAIIRWQSRNGRRRAERRTVAGGGVAVCGVRESSSPRLSVARAYRPVAVAVAGGAGSVTSTNACA